MHVSAGNARPILRVSPALVKGTTTEYLVTVLIQLWTFNNSLCDLGPLKVQGVANLGLAFVQSCQAKLG